MTERNAINAIVRDMDDPRYPCLLGVACDTSIDLHTDCGASLESDFLVHQDDSREIRLGYVLDYAANNGWTVVGRHRPDMAMTHCPEHREMAQPVRIPGSKELVGTQFPGQMPQATWDELMDWYMANGFNPDRSPSTRDIIIGLTIVRWETPDSSAFGEALTQEQGAVLADGEQWSHNFPGRGATARPVRRVTSPVVLPLPQHLRTAIEKAVAGIDLPGELRTGPEWSAQFAVTVHDHDGWRDGTRSWHDPISKDEFQRRAAVSTVGPAQLTHDQMAGLILHDLLTGNTNTPEDQA